MEEKDLIETETPETTVAEQTPSARQPNLLVMGILALALGYQIGIPGIILGAIARTRGNRFLASGGVFTTSNRIGYTLSKAGFIVGLVSTIVIALLIVAMIIFFSVLFVFIASGGLKNLDFNDILMFRW